MRKIYSLTLIFILLIPTSTLLSSVTDLFLAKREADYIRSLDKIPAPIPVSATTLTNNTPLVSYTNSIPQVGINELIGKEIEKNSEALEERTNLGTIEPLPLRKPLPYIKTIYDELDFYKYDSVAHTFLPNQDKSIELAHKIQAFGFDPVRFTMRSNKNDISVNEEIEITISAEFLNVSPRLMFTLEGSTEYTLKMLMPEGFIQTGGTYYDFIKGKVDENTSKMEYTIKGYFEKRTEGAFFRLLRSHIDATEKDLFISKGFLPIRFANELATATTETVITSPTEDPQPNVRAVAASCAEPTASVEIRVVTTPVAPLISTNKNSLCNGESATLTATGCSGTVNWSNGATGVSITVNTGGEYTAFCGTSCGKSSNSNIIVITTNSTPNAPVVKSNKTSLCGTETATLTATGCEGTVKWSNNTTGTNITTNVAGEYSATCTTACGTSGASNEIEIIVGGSLNPPVVSSNWTKICNQGTVTPATLTATGCTANLFWSTGATTTSITVSVAGTYSARCESNCDYVNSNSIVITIGNDVPNSPLINPDRFIACTGETITLSAVACAGTVVWSTGATGNTTTINTSGDYTAKCSNACGLSISSIPLHIDFLPLANPTSISANNNITSLCGRSSITLESSGCGNGAGILWNTNATTYEIKVTSPGTYTAKCINDCSTSINSNVITVTGCPPAASFARPPSLAALSDKSSSVYIAVSGNDICPTTSVTLEAMNCAGSISWCVNGVIDTRHTSSIVVTPTQTTTYKLLCEAAPELSAQSSVICAGTTTTLNTSGCSGESVKYQIKSGSSWLSHATGSPAVANYGVSAGVGTYRAICVSGGVDSPSSNEITITNSTQTVPVPTVSIQGNTGSSITVCGATGAAILKASGCDGGTITWNNGQVGSSMVISTTGTYSAKCTQYCGTTPLNSSFSSNLTVTYQLVCDCSNIAITTNTINGEIPERSTLVLSVPEITNATYRWFGPDIPPSVVYTSPTLTIPNVSPANSGSYSVLVSCRADYLNTQITVTDIDECASSFSYFAYSLSPNGEVGVGEELRFVSDGGDKYEWTGPNGFYSKDQFPTIKLATLSNNGYYTVKISKLIQGTWCDKYVNVAVKIGNCTFDAGPTYSETATDFQLQMWANKPLEGATFEWLKGTTTVSTIGNPTFPKNAGNTGTYTLKVNLRGCTVEKSVKVDFVSPPLYDGHLDIATCDEVSGWILDENNKNKSLSYTIKIKIDNNEIPYTIRSDGGGGLIRFRYVDLGAYKDGLPHNVVVYLPNGTQLRNTTSRSFTCCNLEFNTLTANSCVPPATTGSIAINMKPSYRPTTLQYYLEKQERDEDGNITYKPTGTWQVPTTNQESYTFSSLVPGPYRVTAREGTNGCTVKSGVSVFCENNPGCNNTNVVIFPTGEIKEGVGIIPKLYANVLPEQNPANPDKAGLYLDGTASVSFTNYNYMYGNLTLEAWVNPKAGSSISVGDASDASRQQYLFRGWNGGAANRAAAQVSVGSNGINLIEEGDGYRRVALSYEGLIKGWNHIAVVYKNNLPTLLINGQVVASSTVAPPLNIEIVGPNSVGTDRGKGFVGSVYGFRVWTAALENTVVNQNKTNFDPTLAAYPNVGFWVFDKLPTGNYVEDLSSGKRQAKLEGHAMVLVPPVPVQSPNAPVITWWLAGIKVATGSTYTVPANKVKAGTLNYVVRYQKTDGTYCDTAVPVVIAPANYGSLSGCYIIKSTEGDPKPIAPFYNPNTSAYTIKKGYAAQGSEKEIWRFEHLGSEIYRINSAFFNDMALEGLTNEITLKNKRVSAVAQQWKANVVNASAMTFSLVPQNNLTKRLHYDATDNSEVTLSTSNGTSENFILQPTACPLPAGECSTNNLITYERWLEGRLQTMPSTQWANLNVAQYIAENPNPYTVQVNPGSVSLNNSTANSFPGKPTAPTWQDSRYVNRLSGYICPPKNGDYTFYIKTDEWAELWMSTDEDPTHKRKIANCYGYASSFTSLSAEQKSVPITLTKGRSYYFEVILKDEINSLDVQVAWQVPDAYVAENLLQPMPISGNISSIPRSITPSVLTVSASSLKVAATENVTLTATGCNYGRVIWKAGLEVVQNPNSSMPTLTRQGPGIYQAMCVGDYTVTQDWVMVKVDLNGTLTPVVTGASATCPGTPVTLTATGAPNGYTYQWFTINNAQAWKENHSSMPNIFDDMPTIFNKTTQNTLSVPSPGTYYVRIVNSSGYQSPIKEYTVLPAIPATVKATNDSPTPVGNPLVLTATDIAGATYAWTGPNSYTANTRTATRTSFDASMVGIYTVTITTAASVGGCSVTATTEVIPANCDIYVKATNPSNSQETYSLPRKVGGGFNPLTLKIENLNGTAINLSPYNIQWMLNGNPMADAPNAGTLSTDKIGEYVAILSLKLRPENTCEAKVNINAIPCKVYDGVPTCGTAPSNIEIPSTTTAGINLASGDKFTVADYTVVVTEITSGSSGGWNGKGYIEFRLINNIAISKVSVLLENAVINECYQLASGKVITEYDNEWKGILDIDNAIAEAKAFFEGIGDVLDDLRLWGNQFTDSEEDKEAIRELLSKLKDSRKEIVEDIDYNQSQINAILVELDAEIAAIDDYFSTAGGRMANQRTKEESAALADKVQVIKAKAGSLEAKIWQPIVNGICDKGHNEVVYYCGSSDGIIPSGQCGVIPVCVWADRQFVLPSTTAFACGIIDGFYNDIKSQVESIEDLFSCITAIVTNPSTAPKNPSCRKAMDQFAAPMKMILGLWQSENRRQLWEGAKKQFSNYVGLFTCTGNYAFPNECDYLQGRIAGEFVSGFLIDPGGIAMKGTKMALTAAKLGGAIKVIDQVAEVPAKISRAVMNTGGRVAKGTVKQTAKYLSATGQLLGEWAGGVFKFTKSNEINPATWIKVRTITNVEFDELGVGGQGRKLGTIEVWQECVVGGSGGRLATSSRCQQAIKAIAGTVSKFAKAQDWLDWVRNPACNKCKGWWSSKIKPYATELLDDFTGPDWDLIKNKYARKVEFDCYGFPDFSPFVASIGNALITVEIDDMGESNDFTKAKQKFQSTFSFQPSSWNNGVPDLGDGIDYTWHHHQDGKTMLLVPSLVNLKIKHLGGDAIGGAGLHEQLPKFGSILNCH